MIILRSGFIHRLALTLVFALAIVSFGCQKSAEDPNEKRQSAAPNAKQSFQKDGISGNFSVKVTIGNIKTLTGTVSGAIYNTQENYNNGGSVRGERVLVSKATHSMIFADLPPGEYAIRIFHDINSNQEMDTNSFGIPTEPFAFSNNAKGMMGPASWEDAKFMVDGKTVAQTITFAD